MRILLFVIFFYLVYFVIRNIFLKPFRQGFAEGGRSNNAQEGRPSKREGDISIDYDPRKSQNRNNGVGEYVDYEEVD